MKPAFEQYLTAAAAGEPVEVKAKTAELISKQIGWPRAGWLAIQPLMERVFAEQPDLLD